MGRIVESHIDAQALETAPNPDSIATYVCLSERTQLQCAMLHSRLLEQLMFLRELAHTLTRFIAIDQRQTGWRTVYSVRA